MKDLNSIEELAQKAIERNEKLDNQPIDMEKIEHVERSFNHYVGNLMTDVFSYLDRIKYNLKSAKPEIIKNKTLEHFSGLKEIIERLKMVNMLEDKDLQNLEKFLASAENFIKGYDEKNGEESAKELKKIYEEDIFSMINYHDENRAIKF